VRLRGDLRRCDPEETLEGVTQRRPRKVTQRRPQNVRPRGDLRRCDPEETTDTDARSRRDDCWWSVAPHCGAEEGGM